MKQRIDLQVENREVGKHFSRQLRKQSRVPAIVYGSIANPVNVSLHVNDVLKYNTRAFENALFSLKSSNKDANGKVELIKTVDVHPNSRRPVHVDLFAIDLNKPIRVFVEILFEGKAAGLAEGGILNVVNRQIEVECKPTEIPDNITADVTNLNLGNALHVSDLTIPVGLKIISAPDTTLAVVVEPEAEVVATPAPEAAAAAAPGATPAAGAATATPAATPAKAAPEKKK